MLVVTRRSREGVVIGDPANPLGKVRVESIKGDRVRLGCDFPSHVQVHREEIAAEIVAAADSPAKKHRERPAWSRRKGRPVIEIAPAGESPKIPRHRKLDDPHIGIVLWFASVAGVMSPDDLAAKMDAQGWKQRALCDLIEWRVLERDDRGAVSLTDKYGRQAATAYTRWAR